MRSSIKSFVLCFSAGIITMISACNINTNDQKSSNMATTEDNELFNKGEAAPAGYFTGAAFIHPLVGRDNNNEFALGSVTFKPGARTIWHTHPKGQVLIVSEGQGFYQEKGKPAQRLKKGDVVNIPENVEHWHGADAQHKLVHIAITNYKDDQNVVWLKPVSEQEYADVNK
ncbi:quercetin dioxygenase-like cupin family protein [Pedobacter sp. UYP1]|jgi:quercetin dioxygenase-like cupin family protein